MSKPNLDERIAAAFSANQKSEVVAALIKEAEAALTAANTAAEEARARALDPTLTAKEVAEARRNMEDAAFARDRLQAALPRLNERLRRHEAAQAPRGSRAASSCLPALEVAIPRVGLETRLVRFEHDKADPYLWPRPAPRGLFLDIPQGECRRPRSRTRTAVTPPI